MRELKDKNDLIKLIQKAAWLGMDVLLPVRAIVKSVDESNYKITAIKVEDESEQEAPEYDAYLRAATVGALGVIMVPEVNSMVVIAFSGNRKTQAVVIGYSKIEKIIFNVKTKIEFKIDGHGSSVITIDQNGNVLGDPNQSEPIPKGNKLKDLLQDMISAINKIKDWGSTGKEGTGGTSDTGGIAPLTGVDTLSFDDSILSQNNEVS